MCKDKQRRLLCESFLPLSEFVAAADGLGPLLELEDAEHARWQSLNLFGVGVRNNVQFYMLCLDKLSGQAVKPGRVKFLLNQIQARCRDEDRESVK